MFRPFQTENLTFTIMRRRSAVETVSEAYLRTISHPCFLRVFSLCVKKQTTDIVRCEHEQGKLSQGKQMDNISY